MEGSRLKINFFAAGLLILGVSPVLGGCSLAREEVKGTSDKLAGVFLTKNYLAFEPQLELGTDGELRFADQERKIYAKVGDRMSEELIWFENLEGYGAYDLQLWNEALQQYDRIGTCDEIFADGHYTVTGEGTSVETTVYIGDNGPGELFFNPVYQQEDGSVYLIPGSGLSWNSLVSSSHTISETRSVTENGVERTEGRSFTVNVKSCHVSENLRLFFMDGDSRVLQIQDGETLKRIAREDGAKLQIPQGVEYLIFEQTASDGWTERSIYGREDAEVSWLEKREDGYMSFNAVYLVWE